MVIDMRRPKKESLDFGICEVCGDKLIDKFQKYNTQVCYKCDSE